MRAVLLISYVLCDPLCRQILVPYFAASSTATATALTLNKVIAKVSNHTVHILSDLFVFCNWYSQRVSPLVARLIPFTAIAAANCINIPLMRQNELRSGIPVYDQEESQLGVSKVS